MEHKYHVLSLPSRLKPYDRTKVQSVSCRFLIGDDEKYIGGLTLTNWDKKYCMLLENVIKGIDPKELTLGDRTYIAIWLSTNCYSSIYPIETSCDNCFENIEIEVDLQKLPKIELHEGFNEPYPVTLIDGTIINLRLLRVKDNIAYADYVSNKKQDDTKFKLALSMCDDMNIVDRMEFLGKLNTKDLGILRAFHDKHVHGVNLDSYEYICPKCKEAGNTPVPFRFEMLFPSNEVIEKFARSRV